MNMAATIDMRASAVLIMPLGCSMSFLHVCIPSLLTARGHGSYVAHTLHCPVTQHNMLQHKVGDKLLHCAHLHEVIREAAIDVLGSHTPAQVADDKQLRQGQGSHVEGSVRP